MVGQPGRLLTKGRLLRAVWGTAYADEGHYLHVYVSRLRRKLACGRPVSGVAGGFITAEPGVGYRIGEPSSRLPRTRNIERSLSGPRRPARPFPLGARPTVEAWTSTDPIAIARRPADLIDADLTEVDAAIALVASGAARRVSPGRAAVAGDRRCRRLSPTPRPQAVRVPDSIAHAGPRR